MTRREFALARLGLTRDDIETLARGFLRTIAQANKELVERFT